MTIADKAVLVTGANRGIGQALIAIPCQCRTRSRHRAGSMMVRSHQPDYRSANTRSLRSAQ